MSPTKRPSTVAGLRRGVGTAEGDRIARPVGAEEDHHPTPSARAKPVRVTLNIPPDLFRQLARWTDTAAEALDVPRVGVQDALRAMIRVGVGDTAATVAVLDLLRSERGHTPRH
jgi:hypothetical protein